MILITILGQTSSGKSELAVQLAVEIQKQNLNEKNIQHQKPVVWIVNSDSRQVYQELNIGTGKVHGDWINNSNLQSAIKKIFIYKSLPHFLIDHVPIKQKYNVSDFVEDFVKLLDVKKQPDYIILTGGTGLYAKAIYNELALGKIKPEFENLFDQTKLNLQNLDLLKLQELYLNKSKELDTKLLNNSDFHNPRRLVSFLLKDKVKSHSWNSQISYPKFEKKYLFAICKDQNLLKELINTRLDQRIKQGLLQEIQNLIAKYGHTRMEDFGLEYRLTSLYIKGQLTEYEWKIQMLKENLNYAKRQLTWLKKEEVLWIEDFKQILKYI